MEKILINLNVPSIEKEFDILLPSFFTIGEVIPLLVEALNNISQNMYLSSKCEVLCRANPEMVLLNHLTVAEYGIRHGETLFLI